MIVADASAIVDLLLGEETTRARLRAALLAGAPIEAPDLLTLEVVSAVTRVARAGLLSRQDGEEVLGSYVRLPIRHRLTHPYASRIAALASRHSVYDAAYVVLAEALGAPLLTTDRRLARSVASVPVTLV